MTMIRFLTPLLRDRRGVAATMMALSLTALTGVAAITIDLGSAYVAKRQLQGIADAAVLAAASGDVVTHGTSSAQAIINQSGVTSVTINSLTPGIYQRDTEVAPDARFAADTTDPTGARLTLDRQVPLFFGKFILGRPTITVSATATAARADLAAFSIGTRLASLSGGIANELLSGLTGTSLNLSLVDTQSLVSADMDLLHFADALRVRLNMSDASYAELFGTQVSLRDLVHAMADAAPSVAARDALAKVAAVVGTDSLRLDDMIDLGPIGQANSADGQSAIVIDAFSLLRATLQQSRGENYQSSINLTVPGLTSVKLLLVGNNGTAQSPWMTVTDARDVVIRTGRIRIHLEVKLASALAGISTIRVPLYVELAEAQARLSDIHCSGDATGGSVTLAVTPSIGSAAIADINSGQIADFSSAMTMQPAVLVDIIGTKIRANSQILLGGTQAKSVTFSSGDIAARVTKTVATDDVVAGLAVSLVSHMQLSLTTLGMTVTTGPLLSAVGGVLTPLAPTLDGLINQVTGLLGVKLGMADVRVERMRCGVPLLVA
jgi:uncharacterized membrane protein